MLTQSAEFQITFSKMSSYNIPIDMYEETYINSIKILIARALKRNNKIWII